MQHLTFAIYSSNIDHIKGYNTLSYLKLHVEFEYCNLLEPNLTWDTVLKIYDFAVRLLRSKNVKSILSYATSEVLVQVIYSNIYHEGIAIYILYLMSYGR